MILFFITSTVTYLPKDNNKAYPKKINRRPTFASQKYRIGFEQRVQQPKNTYKDSYMKKEQNSNFSSKLIKQKWGTPQAWELEQQQISNKKANWGTPSTWSYHPWGLAPPTSAENTTNTLQNQWGQSAIYNGQQETNSTISKSWGYPSSWEQPKPIKTSQNGPQNFTQLHPWGNPGFPGDWPTIFETSSNHSSGFSTPREGHSGRFSYNPHPNAWTQSAPMNLKGSEYFNYLKQKGIEDECICLLSSQGIDSISSLRECSQEALVAVGIKLAEVLKLKKL